MEFEGYRAIAMNTTRFNSQAFDSTPGYDLMIPFRFDGKEWAYSLYTTKEIDCSAIAKKFGGGGHKKSAGFKSRINLFASCVLQVDNVIIPDGNYVDMRLRSDEVKRVMMHEILAALEPFMEWKSMTIPGWDSSAPDNEKITLRLSVNK